MKGSGTGRDSGRHGGSLTTEETEGGNRRRETGG
jgi:hypothetical protein